MSVSKIHISKFTGSAAEATWYALNNDPAIKDNVNNFCNKFIKSLNSGLSNDYSMIWDNYSVGSDQIDYIYEALSIVSEHSGRIRNSSWNIAFGFGFKSSLPKGGQRKPTAKVHRLIFFNVFKVMPLVDYDLVVLIEEVLGPTIRDEDVVNMQNEFTANLLGD